MSGKRRQAAPERCEDYVQLRGRVRRRPPLANALVAWAAIADRLRRRRLALFLDFDGTLAPIAPIPQLATLSPDMRFVLDAIGRRWPVAIVSGRALDDLEALVGLRHLVYAGSHGYDIRGPGGLLLQVAVESESAIRAAAAELRLRADEIAGAAVEDKRFAVALHYRQVPRGSLSIVKRVFDEVRRRYPQLRPSTGKRVLELRPDADWDKGRAVTWLLGRVGLRSPEVVPVYVGDDVTDEDAFRAIAGRGVAVLVGAVPWSTNAEFSLRDTREVHEFLLRLAGVGPVPEVIRGRSPGSASEGGAPREGPWIPATW